MTSVSSSRPRCFEVLARGRRDGLVGVLALDFELGVEIAVLVPAAVHELDEAGAAFEQAAGDQAVVGEGAFAHARRGP